MPAAPAVDYEELRRHVAKAAARICPSWLSAEREDIIQVAMLKLHQVFERGGEGSGQTSSSYIWRTAFSVTVDEIRRRTRRAETGLEESEAAVLTLDAGPDPERRALSRELGRTIRECLVQLADPRRAAVVLYLQGHQASHIANLLGWNTKKAENLVYRGLSDLRSCLASKGMK
jgi:RNA polymerase sigma-70 factor (ECF subfamily)